MIYCKTCNRQLKSDKGLLEHRMNSSKHIVCRFCKRDFATIQARTQHYINNSSHNYCVWCDKDFKTSGELVDHNQEEHYECIVCNMLLCTKDGFEKHQNEKNHWSCFPCHRVFQNQNSLKQHIDSGTHQAKSHICPGRNCRGRFVSWSALVSHFESGACHSGLDRQQLNEPVVRHDQDSIITSATRLIREPYGSEPVWLYYKFWATQWSWNGRAYECFLCHKEFRRLDSLNQHLQSPIHEDKIYRCPNPRCAIEYSVLSSLAQHVESGGCGVNRFREVKSAIDSLTERVRSITI